MNIEELMNNPEFRIDIGSLLMRIHSENLMNSYHLKAILKRQIKILEIQKGKTGQELDDAIESEIESLNDKFSEWLKEDLINDVNDFSKD
ncbi:hypothetical protein [uncultured Christiangramia sp.]|uniref:hypothetical protein n=1 Tax=uncultured Christiangramia sp. TaxID=503836 RepID=UPI002625407A|nr:hypothetical protein [uncultured Christiangramia sp.]